MKFKLGSPTKQTTQPAFENSHLRSAFLRSTALWLSLSITAIASGAGVAPVLADGGAGGNNTAGSAFGGEAGTDNLSGGSGAAGNPGAADPVGGHGGGGGGSGGD